MKRRWENAKLGELVEDLTESRTFTVLPDDKITDPTISSATHSISSAGSKFGLEVKVTKRVRIEPGDLVFSRLHTQNGAFAYADRQYQATGTFIPLRVNEGKIDKQFLHWALHIYVPSLSASDTVGRETYRTEDILALGIPLPSLAEQRKIVAQIEALSAKIGEAQRLREQTAKESEAIQGSAATELIQGSGAKCIPIDSLAEVRGGIQKGPHRTPGNNPVRYLTVAHVHRNRISTSDPRFFEVSRDELERWRLESGDVLIIEGNGSAEQIGRTALFRGEIANCVHQNHVIRIRPNRDMVDPEFLNVYLNSPAGQDEVQARSRTTSGLRSLSVGRIKQITVPVPSPSDQRRIVAYLDGLQANVDALKKFQVETAAELDALLPSILDKAFKGEL